MGAAAWGQRPGVGQQQSCTATLTAISAGPSSGSSSGSSSAGKAGLQQSAAAPPQLPHCCCWLIPASSNGEGTHRSPPCGLAASRASRARSATLITSPQRLPVSVRNPHSVLYL